MGNEKKHEVRNPPFQMETKDLQDSDAYTLSK